MAANSAGYLSRMWLYTHISASFCEWNPFPHASLTPLVLYSISWLAQVNMGFRKLTGRLTSYGQHWNHSARSCTRRKGTDWCHRARYFRRALQRFLRLLLACLSANQYRTSEKGRWLHRVIPDAETSAAVIAVVALVMVGRGGGSR